MEVSPPVPPPPLAESPAETTPREPPQPTHAAAFAEVLHALGSRLDAGARLVARAERGGTLLDARQLIALQSGIYRYTEAVDLTAKLIDRAGNALKTTLQSQG